MPSVRATMEIPVNHEQVYEYLRTRYTTNVFESVSVQSKGYCPEVEIIED